MPSYVKSVAPYIGVGILVILVLVQRAEIKDLRRKVDSLDRYKHNMMIARMLQGLKIPSEALYWDWDAMKEVARARQKYWTARGTEEFWPYKDWGLTYLQDPPVPTPLSELNAHVSGFSSRPVPPLVEPMRKTDSIFTIIEGSFEHWWLEHATTAVLQLATDFQYNQGLGPYFDENPGEFDRLVKPWLLRMTKAYGSHMSLPACALLLQRGDRSQDVVDALRRVMRAGGFDRDKAMSLNRKHHLGLQPVEHSGTDPNR